MNLVYMDLLQTDLWINNIIDLESSDDDALCPSFKLAGYNSKFTISNLGSTFAFLFVLISYQVMLLITKQLFTYIFPIKWIKKQIQKGLDQLYWNSHMRFAIQQYQAILLSSLVCVNLSLNSFHISPSQFQQITETVGEKMSVYLGIALFAASILVPLAMGMVVYLHQRAGTLMSSKFQQRYGTLLEGLDVSARSNFLKPYWSVITLFRWGFQISMFVFLKDFPDISDYSKSLHVSFIHNTRGLCEALCYCEQQ
ncbi:hypothetical protein FGO68_gene13711 [Halteria grandinella]|uniref:Uncharacterized protein n=1 Tax=Halteria grandinella TaxID=5974 RepID=A0A8J8P4G2_HALGN|nr:hypothetical protein FGO68_gene13711 [Halteria grandinella]